MINFIRFFSVFAAFCIQALMCFMFSGLFTLPLADAWIDWSYWNRMFNFALRMSMSKSFILLNHLYTSCAAASNIHSSSKESKFNYFESIRRKPQIINNILFNIASFVHAKKTMFHSICGNERKFQV